LILIFALFIAGHFFGCVSKEIREEKPLTPPNVRTYYHPKSKVWKQLVQIIRNEYLIPFDYASPKRGYFACQEIKSDDQTFPKTKSRLSGSLTFDGSGIVVTLYRQVAFWDENEKIWKAIPTDYFVEASILNRLSQRLGGGKKK
jgi:hypothetical protein